MGFFRDVFKTRSKDWYYGKLEDSQVPNQEPSKAIQPNKFYINIWLRSLRIVDVRRGLNSFYPVVHSFVSLPYLGKTKPVEFNMLTTPTKLQSLDAKRIDRVITLNKRMLGPIPYRGGDLELEVGLFSIKAADLAGPYLNLMEDISKKAGVSFINQALQFAEPLKTGINLLTGGSDDTILEVGLSSTYSSNILKTGYYAVVRAEKNKLNPENLKIDPNDYKLLYNENKIEDYPYIVFEITTTEKKDDWWAVPRISESYNDLVKSLEDGKLNEIEDNFKVFKRVVQTASELLPKDRASIIANVKKEIVDPLSESTGVSINNLKGKIKSLREIEIYN